MNKQICFAGFPDCEIQALRSATSACAHWECHFVPQADAALALISEKVIDVVVANMAMAGKNGAMLLQEVGRLQPQALGFIVGEVSDQALLVDCLGGAYHFIRRPVSPGELITTLQRGLKLDVWLSNDEIRELAPRLRRLPSLPSTYFNLLKEMESPAATLQTIGSIIARDPVVTARLLHMVNSAAFSLAQKVSDPLDALAMLGLETIKSLVLCLQIFTQNDEAREAGLSLEILWEHSVQVGKFARQITLKQTGDTKWAGDAFTAGLLHDVGRIVIASNLPKEYAAVVAAAREQGRPLEAEETAQLGINHAKVGAYLLGLWGLPATIIEAAAAHHAPGKTAFACEFSLLAAIHAANVFAHQTSGQTDGLPLPQLDQDYFRAINFDGQVAQWREWCTGEKAPAPAPPSGAPPVPEQSVTGAPPIKSPPGEPISRVPIDPPVHLWKWAVPLLLITTALLAWHFASRPAKPAPEANLLSAPALSPTPQATPKAAEVKPEISPEPAKSAAHGVPSNAPASPFDTVKIDGIFYRPVKPQAIINHRAVEVGDHIGGLEVLAIGKSSVTLSTGTEQRVFGLK